MNLFLHLEAEGHPYHQKEGVQAEKSVYTNLVASLIDYPKPLILTHQRADKMKTTVWLGK